MTEKKEYLKNTCTWGQNSKHRLVQLTWSLLVVAEPSLVLKSVATSWYSLELESTFTSSRKSPSFIWVHVSGNTTP